MPSHYDDGEYKGSEHATDVFKAPTPEPIPETEGQKLEKRPEDYIDIGELNEDGEPLHWSGWPLHLLGKVGDAFESVDKAVLGRIGTEDANLYKARRGTIDALSEQHFALGLLGEIFIPDTVDIATAGLAYIPNRFRKLGKAGVKLWAKLNKGGMAADSVRLSKLEAQKLFNYEVDEFGNLGQAFAHTGDFNRSADDLAEEILKSSKYELEASLTGPRDLGLYGASPSQFDEITDINKALTEAVPRGGRRVKFGDHYYTIHTKQGENVITPYNKWYQQNIDPFKIPKDIEAKWRSQESGTQLDIFKGAKDEIPYGTKGKTRQVPKTIKYPAGTVDEFKAWYKNLFDLQGEERELMRKLSVLAEKADLVPAKPKGKKFFEMDRSHIVPRSKGGSGLTFLEAWMANQKRGADWILDSDALQRAGIPRNWDELFNEWLAAKKSGGTIQTGLGPLDNINVDDYFAVEKGVPLSVVARRRQNIRNLVNRARGGETEVGTLARDYRNMVLESKGYEKFDDIKLNNPQILDLEYAALNYDDLIELGEL